MKNDIYGRIIPPYPPKGQSIPITPDWPYWSIWAGLLFLKSDLLTNTNSNSFIFFPKMLKNGFYLDTGGGLWDTVLNKIPFPEKIVKYSTVKFRNSEISNIHTDYYECLDDWVHIVNLSNWYDTPAMQEKIKYFENFLTLVINKG